MFWVIQNNIYREQKHSILIQTLKEKGIPHQEVKVVPFTDIMLPSDFDSHAYYGEVSAQKEVTIETDEPIMVLGGTSLTRIAKNRGWSPGSFLNKNFHYDKWKKALGSHLLNEESIVGSFRSIQPLWNSFFIRPCEDTKDFAGLVCQKQEFEAWRHELINEVQPIFSLDTEVIAAPTKEIVAEYRFFIVDGTVITYSQYKKGSDLFKSADIPHDVVEFAEKMISLWQPARAFVLDIAETEKGFKVIEINNINSAGFYEADVLKLIRAIEQMKY